MPHPFRFASTEFTLPTRQAWIDWAHTLEVLGYDVFLMPDHLGAHFAPALTLLAVADATTTLRIGTTVYDNDFRHPVLLANEAATLDVLSEGRFEFGIGAGWDKSEYDRAGIPFDPPGARVDRMIEAVGIIKQLWSGAEVHHAGEHYTISGLSDPVRPIQQPHPPIFIGGGGKRLLSFAAREADIIGFLAKARPEGGINEILDDDEDALARKLAWVREAAGERFERLELGLLIQKVSVTDHPRRAADEIAGELGNVRAEQVLKSVVHLIGSIEAIIERLIELRERFGISYITVFPVDAEAFAPVVARLKGR